MVWVFKDWVIQSSRFPPCSLSHGSFTLERDICYDMKISREPWRKVYDNNLKIPVQAMRSSYVGRSL